MFRKKVRFYREELLSPPPAPKLEDKILSALRDSIFIIFEPTPHIGDHSSNRMPCRGNRDPPIMGLTSYDNLNEKLAFNPF